MRKKLSSNRSSNSSQIQENSEFNSTNSSTGFTSDEFVAEFMKNSKKGILKLKKLNF